MEDEILTVDECAKYLKVDRKTLCRLIRDRKKPIPATKIGGQWRISKSRLDEKLFGVREKKAS